MMPSSHFILCRTLLLPPIPPHIRVFSNESTLHMRWPKYWSLSFNISPSNEHSGLIFRMDWLDLLALAILIPVFASSSPAFLRRWHPTPELLPGKSHGQRSPVGCSPWGRSESERTEQLHFHFSPSCIGEGNGNPLQCPCLQNPRDREAWWAAVYGVAQSQT